MEKKRMDINSPVYAVAFIAALAAVLSAAVSALQAATVGTVAENETLRRSAVLVELFDLNAGKPLDRKQAAKIAREHTQEGHALTDPQTGRRFDLIMAYREPRRADGSFDPRSLIGYAFPFEGLGFWAPIRGLLAVNPAADTIIGIAFTEQKETPGLGGRIKEKWFRDKFAGLTIRPEPRAPKIINVGLREPPAGTFMVNRHVDAISGATQTCMALDRMLNENIAAFQRAFAAARLSEEQ